MTEIKRAKCCLILIRNPKLAGVTTRQPKRYMKPTIKSVTWRHVSLPFAAAFVLLGMRLASAADYPTTILADHPVAYYRLEEPNGSATVTDSSGNGNIGYVTYVTQG